MNGDRPLRRDPRSDVYMDDTDLSSKQLFLQIQILFLARLSQATRGTQTTPLLTIPVK